MAIRVKCKCGTSLKVSSKQAGLRLSCPGCGKPFRIPAEKFQAMAEKARAASPKTQPVRTGPRAPARTPPTVTPDPVPVPLDIVPVSLDSEIPTLDLDLAAPVASPPAGARSGKKRSAASAGSSSGDVLYELAADASDAESSAAPAAAIPVPVGDAPTIGYAAEPATRATHLSRRVSLDTIEGPKRGFWADAFMSFAYPFLNVGNTVTFFIVAFIAALQVPMSWAGCLGLLGNLIISGWICSLYFSVIQEAASGSEDLPGIKMEGGAVESIIKPLIRWIGAFLSALCGPIVLGVLLYCGVAPPAAGYLMPIWLALAIFVLPVCLLLFAFNAPGMILRVDLIVVTIVRTILPYLGMWLMLMLVTIIYLMPVAGSALAQVGLRALAIDTTAFGLGGEVVFQVLDVYLTIVSMRLIGLYYLHFKKRFAIRME